MGKIKKILCCASLVKDLVIGGMMNRKKLREILQKNEDKVDAFIKAGDELAEVLK